MVVLKFIGVVLVAILSGKSLDAVSRNCRDMEIYASVNVDGWRNMDSACSRAEQNALLREHKARGLDATPLEKSLGIASSTE